MTPSEHFPNPIDSERRADETFYQGLSGACRAVDRNNHTAGPLLQLR
jgi:hypothetical protein